MTPKRYSLIWQRPAGGKSYQDMQRNDLGEWMDAAEVIDHISELVVKAWAFDALAKARPSVWTRIKRWFR